MMDLNLSDDDDSECEVFVGPITLREIKKRFLPRKHRHANTGG